MGIEIDDSGKFSGAELNKAVKDLLADTKDVLLSNEGFRKAAALKVLTEPRQFGLDTSGLEIEFAHGEDIYRLNIDNSSGNERLRLSVMTNSVEERLSIVIFSKKEPGNQGRETEMSVVSFLVYGWGIDSKSTMVTDNQAAFQKAREFLQGLKD